MGVEIDKVLIDTNTFNTVNTYPIPRLNSQEYWYCDMPSYFLLIRLKNMASLSTFYAACANNDVNTVRRKLLSMTLEEVNRIEQNGSTALHVAASNGNLDIVKLLLEKGAARQVRISNSCS